MLSIPYRSHAGLLREFNLDEIRTDNFSFSGLTASQGTAERLQQQAHDLLLKHSCNLLAGCGEFIIFSNSSDPDQWAPSGAP